MRKTHLRQMLCIVATGSLAIGLAGCNLTKKEVAPPPLINGDWVSGNNLTTATFNNGQFVSRANDTGKVAAQGNYVLIDDTRVQIRWHSNATGKDNSANCTKNGSNKLNCTDQNGNTFTLTRA